MQSEPGTYSVVGIRDDGTRVFLCVNLHAAPEAHAMAKTLDRLGEYARVEVDFHPQDAVPGRLRGRPRLRAS